MNNLREVKKGYIDIYHGKANSQGNDKAPVFEGQVKLEDGTIIRFKAWQESNSNYTKGERFSGYVYQTVKEE
jgi:hypothetical protein